MLESDTICTKVPPSSENMSKSQWKKLCKKKRLLDNKEKYKQIRKEKRQRAKEARRLQINEFLENGQNIPEELKRKPKKNVDQVDSGVKIIMDCAFDDLMNDKEIISMTNQITRAYSSNNRENYYAKIIISSFNKRLKERFDTQLKDSNYQNWKNFEFINEDIIPTDNVIYLTPDSDEILDRLESGMTYIVGGIVDKNRHKSLCYNKAKKLGISTKRLPITEYIKLNGRQVLTTVHVIQLILKYFDNKDWKESFLSVFPSRKLVMDEDNDQEKNNENNSDNCEVLYAENN